MFQPAKTCINQAIHVLLMHGFCTLQIRIQVTKNDVIKSSDLYLKNLRILHAFARHYSNTNVNYLKHFLQSFQVTK